MKKLEQLTNILKECKEVKEQLEELKFGCFIKNITNGEIERIVDIDGKYFHTAYDFYEKFQFEIIGNPIQLHHLIQYCNSKRIFCLYKSGDFIGVNLSFHDGKRYEDIKLDITKELHEQTDEVLEKIINFLKEYE